MNEFVCTTTYQRNMSHLTLNDNYGLDDKRKKKQKKKN